MSIVITIEGNHPTDVLAQLRQLAEGLKHSCENTNPVVESKTVQGRGFNIEEAKKIAGKQLIIEADKMIADGKIDDVIFPLLNKKQRERVEEALKTKEAALVFIREVSPTPTDEKTEAGIDNDLSIPKHTNVKKDVGGLFDDEELEELTEVTIDILRALITKKCKDKNGKDIPEMYSAVRAEIKNVVPKDKEPKVSEVPASKYADLYDAINSLGA